MAQHGRIRTALLLVLTALVSACGGVAPPQAQAPTAAERPKLTVWLSTSFTPLADELQKRFVLEWANAKNVEVTIVQDSSTVLGPQLNAAIEAKQLPDVLSWASPDWAPRLHRLGLLADVTDVVSTNNGRGGGLYDPALLAVTDKGKQFAIPTHSATEVLYVRKSLLEQAGMEPPKTWDEVLEVARAINDPGTTWGWGKSLGIASYDAEIQLLSMLASYGSSPYAADGVTPNLDNEGTRQLLALLKEAWDAGLIPQDAVTWDDAGNNKAYLTRSAGIIYNTGSVINAMRKDDPELLEDTLVLPIPSGPEGQRLLGYIYGLMVTKDSAHPDLAKDLVLYLTDVERQAQIVEAAGSNYMPLYKELASREMWKDPYNAILIGQLANNAAIGYPGPTTEWALEAWRTHTVTEMVNSVLTGEKPVDKAISDAEEKLRQIYAQLQQQ